MAVGGIDAEAAARALGTDGPRGTLLLHTGGTKTGSSALQNLFRDGAGRLAALGVAYRGAPPVPPDVDVGSGNAAPLAAALLAGRDAEARSRVRGFLGEGRIGLASSEEMEDLDEAALRRLAAVAAREGVALRVVHLVRDPVPLALSTYDQRIKGDGESRPIDEWQRDYALAAFPFLRALHALEREGLIALRVLRYEDARLDLAGAVLAALGLPPRLLDGLEASVPTNRSLTAAERDILRRVNAALLGRPSHDLARLLIGAAPGRRAEPAEAPGLAGALRGRYGEEVAWVNRTFFPGGPGLAWPDPDADGPPTAPRPEAAPSPEALALDWAIRRMALEAPAARAEDERFLDEVRRAPRPDDPDLPPDFDPVAYLRCHPSLLERRVDPYRHWLTRGRARGLGWTR